MDIVSIYKRSFNVAIKYKRLWIIGAFVAVLAGGGGGGGNYSNFSSNSKDSFKNLSTPDFQPVLDQILSIVKQIPSSTWIFLVVALLVSMLFGILISVLSISWAEGALIGGIQGALENKNLSLSEISQRGFKNLKGVIWLKIVPGLLMVLAIVVFAFVGTILTVAVMPLGIAFFIFVGLGLVIVLILIALTQVWAIRVAVIEGLSGRKAFARGFSLMKRSVGKMLGLGLTNCFAGCLVGCASMLILAPLVGIGIGTLMAVGGLSAVANNFYGLIPACGIIVLLVIFAGLIFTVIGAISVVFKYATWNCLYEEVKGEGSVTLKI